MTVLAVGAYTLDLYMFGPRLPAPGESVAATEWAQAHGGKAANVAVAAARLGATSRLVAAVGRDAEGEAALSALRESEVDVDDCPRVDTPTGRGFVFVDRHARQLVTTWPGAGELLAPETVGSAAGRLGPGDVVVVQGEIPIELSHHAAETAASRGATVMLNPSPSDPFGEDAGRRLLRRADIVVLQTGELLALAGSTTEDAAARWLLDFTGARAVVVTRGADGADVVDGAATTRVPAPPVSAVDTTGAGDCFLGVLAASRQAGMALVEGVAIANWAAAASVRHRFCQPSYQTWHQLGVTPLRQHGRLRTAES